MFKNQDVRPNRAADFGGGAFWTMPLIAMLIKEREMLQPDAFCEHTMQQNATAAGASPETSLGELTALPQTPT